MRCVGCDEELPDDFTVRRGAPRKWCDACLTRPTSRRYPETEKLRAPRDRSGRIRTYPRVVGPRKPGKRRERRAVEGGMLLRCARCREWLPEARFPMNVGARRHSHCDDCRAMDSSRRSAKRRAIGVQKVRALTRAKLIARQGGICPLCGKLLAHPIHIDHVIPIACGGLHVDENLQAVHKVCNLRKGAKN